MASFAFRPPLHSGLLCIQCSLNALIGACKCVAQVVCPLFPNPWFKPVWGPFTAFRTSLGLRLYEASPHWRRVLASEDYAHFDEWWGSKRARGWQTMGDVVSKLSFNGTIVLSRAKL